MNGKKHPYGRYDKKVNSRLYQLVMKIEAYVGGNIIDHYSLIYKDNMDGCSIRKLALQPYSVTMEQLEKLIDFCKVNGLTFGVDAGSTHNLGGCIMIDIKGREIEKCVGW